MSILKKLIARAARPLTGLAAIALCSFAMAEPIVFKLNGIGSGMLGTQAFNNATVLIQGLGETRLVTEIEPGVFLHPLVLGSLSVRIGDQSALPGTQGYAFFVNQGHQTAGFTSYRTAHLNSFSAPALASWNGSSPIGPLAVSSTLLAPIDTNGGTFRLDSVNELRFSASVPEPGQWGLLLAGGVMLASVVRTRKRAAARQVACRSGPEYARPATYFPQLQVIPPGVPYFKWPWQEIMKVSGIGFDPDKPSANSGGATHGTSKYSIAGLFLASLARFFYE